MSELPLQNTQPEPEVVIKLKLSELNVVAAALGEIPHRLADPILVNLKQQVGPQLQQNPPASNIVPLSPSK